MAVGKLDNQTDGGGRRDVVCVHAAWVCGARGCACSVSALTVGVHGCTRSLGAFVVWVSSWCGSAVGACGDIFSSAT